MAYLLLIGHRSVKVGIVSIRELSTLYVFKVNESF